MRDSITAWWHRARIFKWYCFLWVTGCFYWIDGILIFLDGAFYLIRLFYKYSFKFLNLELLEAQTRIDANDDMSTSCWLTSSLSPMTAGCFRKPS